jgi:hypothetical protein
MDQRAGSYQSREIKIQFPPRSVRGDILRFIAIDRQTERSIKKNYTPE